MELNKLSNENLDHKIKQLVQKEREILSEVIAHVREADRRRLYLKLAYPNLFSYLTEGCGYSAGSAQRRIDAARLVNAIPEIKQKIESGEITLNQVSLLQKAIRQKSKETKQVVSKETKKEIIENLSHKTHFESQVLISRSLDLPIIETPKETHQADESVRFEVTLTKEQFQKLKRMRELLSTRVPGNWGQVLEYVSDQVLKKDPLSQPNDSKPTTSTKSYCQMAVKTGTRETRYIATEIKQKIFQRDRCCQFQDKQTGKICGTRWNLQLDHIQPVWAGGKNEEKNLRLLCASHNQLRYQEQAGIRTS